MMRIASLIVFFSCYCLICFGQGNFDLVDLEDFLPKEKFQQLSTTDKSKLREKLTILNKGYHITSFGSKSFPEYTDVFEVEKLYQNQPDLSEDLILSGELNLLGYDFSLKNNDYSYYRIGSSDKFLVIPPTDLTLKNSNFETN